MQFLKALSKILICSCCFLRGIETGDFCYAYRRMNKGNSREPIFVLAEVGVENGS